MVVKVVDAPEAEANMIDIFAKCHQSGVCRFHFLFS
jgi:hypothetical protein